jgi:ribosomal protein S18 acetylase RimI-like enzyme
MRAAMPSSTVSIREATIADAESIARLVTELGYPTSSEQMRERLDVILKDEGYTTLVAFDPESIRAFIGMRVGPLYEADEFCGQIMALAVAKDHQRGGMGRMLMETAESHLNERGVRIVVVMSGTHRADAHAFYKRLGYALTGNRFKKVLGER